MKILVAGDFHSQIHEKAFYQAFLALGYDTYYFAWSDHFKDYLLTKPKAVFDFFKFLYYRFQNKFIIGPVIKKINKNLIQNVRKERYDLVFIYRGTHVFPETIRSIKESGALVFGYCNDDPFSKDYAHYFWRYFLWSVPFYDHIFVYRQKNFSDYKKIGYRKTSLLRSYYIKEKNFPISDIKPNKYTCDVVFVGHYEPDHRDELLKSIIEADINFKLFGPEWERSKYYNFFREKFGSIHALNDEEYNLALNSAKIALVFLSKLNNDDYTRRCFEIPAAKTFMLAPYTDDLNGLFKEGLEAEYFRNEDELIRKIKYYLSHEAARQRIAEAGYERLMKDGHEIRDRVKEVVRIYNVLKQKNL